VTILIIGAGPTGLTLAIELARRDVPFRIIDRALAPPATSRALGTQPRTVEVFQIMGIPRSALQPAAPLRAFRLRERGRTVARVAFGAGTREPSPPIVMNEAETERVLTERLAQLGGHVERGVALQAFRYDDDGIVATLTTPSGVAEARAHFLAGCDGAGSLVRRQAGIDFSGASYPEQFLLADLDLAWDVPHDEGTIWLGAEEGIAAAIPLPGERRWRIIVAASPSSSGVTEAEAATRAEEILRQRAGIPLRRIGEPIWGSAFHIHRRLAGRYRAGPVFLAGDAAHVHSPVGGQGMNTGIQDAFNLGWKLALAARVQAAPGLLDTYERERRPVARSVLRATDLGQRLMFGANPAARAIRDTVLPAAIALPPLRERVLAAVSELHIAYLDSPLSDDADGAGARRLLPSWGHDVLRAGERTPDLALRAADGSPVALLDLFARGWTLLLVASATGQETIGCLGEIARQTADTAGEAIQRVLVVPSTPERSIDARVIIDPGNVAAGAFGSGDGLVALVRPDGYLGFRGRPEQRAELATYLARVFAMRVRGERVWDAGNDAAS
jgi:2-polyprenyl-6-methoxyphenol hydroxylase-like FAD-dependent oxidoreductase